MEIEIKNVEQFEDTTLREYITSLDTYAQILERAARDSSYATPETALYAPFDDTLRSEAKKIGADFTAVKKVFLIGIGGSDMGTRAVFESLKGLELHPSRELIDIDTIEEKVLQRAKAVIDTVDRAEEIACIVVSKSGTTTETIANANILYDLLKDTFGEEAARAQTLIITGADTPLYTRALEQGIRTFPIPQAVGGRFSVCTYVGLVPLAVLGFDIDAFCEGAQKAITASTAAHKPKTAAVLATILFASYQNGARVHELFFWNPELETLGKWYRQLLAESLGKQNQEGVAVGFSPSVAIGSVDLHSVGQLIFGGRNDRFTTFVSAPSEWKTTKEFADDSPFTLPLLKGKTTQQLFEAIYAGVKKTYDLHTLPYISIEFSAINERELGAFMGLHMTLVMYMAQLMQVNAFDQPAVETYKAEVRKLLTT